MLLIYIHCPSVASTCLGIFFTQRGIFGWKRMRFNSNDFFKIPVLFKRAGHWGKNPILFMPKVVFNLKQVQNDINPLFMSFPRFDNDRTISFIPPDGEFELMSYRLNTHVTTCLRPKIWGKFCGNLVTTESIWSLGVIASMM